MSLLPFLATLIIAIIGHASGEETLPISLLAEFGTIILQHVKKYCQELGDEAIKYEEENWILCESANALDKKFFDFGKIIMKQMNIGNPARKETGHTNTENKWREHFQEKSKSQIEQHKKEIEKIKEENQQLKKQNDDFVEKQKTLTEMEDDVNNLTLVNEKQQKEIEEFKADYLELAGKYHTVDNKLKILEKTIQTNQQTIEDFANKNRSLEDQNLALIEANEALKLKETEHEQDTMAKNKEIDKTIGSLKLKQTIDELKANNEELTGKNAAAQEKLKELNDKNEALEEELNIEHEKLEIATTTIQNLMGIGHSQIPWQ